MDISADGLNINIEEDDEKLTATAEVSNDVVGSAVDTAVSLANGAVSNVQEEEDPPLPDPILSPRIGGIGPPPGYSVSNPGAYLRAGYTDIYFENNNPRPVGVNPSVNISDIDVIKHMYPRFAKETDIAIAEGYSPDELKDFLTDIEATLKYNVGFNNQQVDDYFGRPGALPGSFSMRFYEDSAARNRAKMIMGTYMSEQEVDDLFDIANITGTNPEVFFRNIDLLKFETARAGERLTLYEVIPYGLHTFLNGWETFDQARVAMAASKASEASAAWESVMRSDLATEAEIISADRNLSDARNDFEQLVRRIDAGDREAIQKWNKRNPKTILGKAAFSFAQSAGFSLAGTMRQALSTVLLGKAGGFIGGVAGSSLGPPGAIAGAAAGAKIGQLTGLAASSFYNANDEGNVEGGMILTDKIRSRIARGQNPLDYYDEDIVKTRDKVRGAQRDNLMYLFGSNVLQYAGTFGLSSFSRPVSKFLAARPRTTAVYNFVRNPFVRYPAVASLEGADEVVQDVIRAKWTGDPLQDGQLAESFVIGSLASLGHVGSAKILARAGRIAYDRWSATPPTNDVFDSATSDKALREGTANISDVASPGEDYVFVNKEALDNVLMGHQLSGGVMDSYGFMTQEATDTADQSGEYAISKKEWDAFSAKYPGLAGAVANDISFGLKDVSIAEKLISGYAEAGRLGDNPLNEDSASGEAARRAALAFETNLAFMDETYGEGYAHGAGTFYGHLLMSMSNAFGIDVNQLDGLYARDGYADLGVNPITGVARTGSISWNPVTGRFETRIAPGGDSLTVFHEVGHWASVQMLQFGNLDTASAQARADRVTLLQFMGLTEQEIAEGLASYKAQRVTVKFREGMEKFAKGMEAFVAAGQAPTVEMQGVFARVRNWLTKLLHGYKAEYGGLDPAIRDVYSRLLSSPFDTGGLSLNSFDTQDLIDHLNFLEEEMAQDSALYQEEATQAQMEANIEALRNRIQAVENAIAGITSMPKKPLPEPDDLGLTDNLIYDPEVEIANLQKQLDQLRKNLAAMEQELENERAKVAKVTDLTPEELARRAQVVQQIQDLPATEVVPTDPVSQKEGKDIARSFGLMENQTDRRPVAFPPVTIGKILGNKGFPINEMLGNLKDLYETSILAWSEPEQAMKGHKLHRNVEAYHFYINKFTDGVNTYFIRFTVRETTPTKKGKSSSLSDNNIHATTISDVTVYSTNDNVTRPTPDYLPGGDVAQSFVDTKLQDFFDSVKTDLTDEANLFQETGRFTDFLRNTPINTDDLINVAGDQMMEQLPVGVDSIESEYTVAQAMEDLGFATPEELIAALVGEQQALTAEVEALQADVDAAQDLVRSREARNGVMKRVRELGKILYSSVRDRFGQDSARELFRRTGPSIFAKNGRGIDEIAAELRAEGYAIENGDALYDLLMSGSELDERIAIAESNLYDLGFKEGLSQGKGEGAAAYADLLRQYRAVEAAVKSGEKTAEASAKTIQKLRDQIKRIETAAARREGKAEARQGERLRLARLRLENERAMEKTRRERQRMASVFRREIKKRLRMVKSIAKVAVSKGVYAQERLTITQMLYSPTAKITPKQVRAFMDYFFADQYSFAPGGEMPSAEIKQTQIDLMDFANNNAQDLSAVLYTNGFALQAFYDKVMSVAADGRANLRFINATREANYAPGRAEVIDGLKDIAQKENQIGGAGKPIDVGREDRVVKNYKGLRGFAERKKDEWYANTLQIGRLVDWIMRGRTSRTGYLYGLMVTRVNQATNQELGNVTQRVNGVLTKLFDECGGMTANSFGEMRTVRGYEYTVDQLCGIYAGMKNEHVRNRLLNGNFDRGSVDEFMDLVNEIVNNVLTANEKKATDIILQDYDVNFDRLNEVLMKEYNEFMIRQEFYMPIIQSSTLTSNDPSEKAGMLGAGMASYLNDSLNRGWSKERLNLTPERTTLIELPVFSNWLTMVKTHEHFIAFAGLAKEQTSLLNSKPTTEEIQNGTRSKYDSVKNLIIRTSGRDAWASIEEYRKIIVTNEKLLSDMMLEGISRWFTKNMSVSYLSYNLATIMKQTTALPRGYQDADVHQLLASLLKLSVNGPAFLNRIYELDPQMKNRKGNIMIEEMTKYLASQKPGLMRVNDSFLKLGFAGMQNVDRWMAAVVWDATYNTEIKKGRSHADAIIKAQDSVISTQQPTRMKDMPRLWRQSGFARLGLLFSLDASQILGMVSYDVPQGFMKDPSGNRNWQRSMRTITAVTLGAMMLYAFMGQGTDADDDGETTASESITWVGDALASQIVGSAPYVGKLAMIGYNAARGKDSIDFEQAPIRAIRAARNIYDKGPNKKNVERLSMNLIETIGQATGKIPVTAIKRLYNTGKQIKDGDATIGSVVKINLGMPKGKTSGKPKIRIPK